MVEIDDAAKRLPDLIDRVHMGDEVVITDAGVPVARLVAARTESAVRRPGSAKGALVVSDDFEAPLPDDELESWS